MEYDAVMYRDLTAFTKGMNDKSRLGWALHSWRQSPTGALYIAVYQRPFPGPAKEPAVAAKVIAINKSQDLYQDIADQRGISRIAAKAEVMNKLYAPGGCVSVSGPDRRGWVTCDGHNAPHAQNEACENPIPQIVKPKINWSSCYICDPEHAAAQNVCDLHRLQSPVGTADQMEKLLESRPWDGGPVHVNSHGRD